MLNYRMTDLLSNEETEITLADGKIVAKRGSTEAKAAYHLAESGILQFEPSFDEAVAEMTWLRMIEGAFGVHSKEENFAQAVRVERSLAELCPSLRNVAQSFDFVLPRTAFFQLPNLWHKSSPEIPESWSQTGNFEHPVRPHCPEGTVYRRFSAAVGKTFEFKVADVERDLEVFHQWHNQPRVSEFWELAKSKDELRDYLEKGLADRHQIPMILFVDGKATGYFEMYWVPEDRLAPFCDHQPWDRGFHFLIGDASFLGFKNTDQALASVVHYLFLDAPRARTIWAEPRADNAKVLKYAEILPAWRKVKEFDFPHKRAALLECTRRRFFEGKQL